jgi:hypothetical protein
MPIVNTEVPITSVRNQRYLQQIAEQYPFTQLEKIGTTDFQRPIWMLTVGTGKRHVLFTAAHHANEWITALVLLKYAEDLAEAIRTNGILFGQRAKEMAAAVTSNWSQISPADLVPLFSRFRISRRVGSARAFSVCCKPIGIPPLTINLIVKYTLTYRILFVN